ncbi:MAG: hypothetical protein F9K29_13375 [Hyphomicrobiaceae bacterium]|nr:MAG: hypothetical protein F9K29_13375 [Hyphomicrobiaceae bacterium]
MAGLRGSSVSVLVLQDFLPRRPMLGRIAGRVALAPATWCALATAVLMFGLPGTDAASLMQWLGDTDDAVRLVAVRELLTGGSWYDTTLARIGAPEPLVSHWSRLIDLPLASLMALLTPVLGPERAELATRILWPALLFFTLLSIVTREAGRQAGTWAAAFAVLLALASITALLQFRPGRVDHHNAQILCAVGGLILLVRSIEDARWGWIAGALLGLGLSIGYEAIGLVVPAVGIAALFALCRPQQGGGILSAAIAMTGTMLAVLAVTQPPARWLTIHCDALSFNLPILAAFGAGGLWLALRGVSDASLPVRLAIAGVTAGAGAGLYAMMEPACLAGPFGQVNPALKPIWLDHVMESKSVLSFGGDYLATALAFAAFVFAGAAAQAVLWRRQRKTADAVMAAIIGLAFVLGCWQIKLMPYASWLAVLPVAVLAARLDGIGSVSAPLVRIAAAVLVSQATLDAAFAAGEGAFRHAARLAAPIADEAEVGRECTRTDNVRRLAALAPGLVAANIDLGPQVVALTDHRVVAAPYHRLDKGILANRAIFDTTAEQAERTLRQLNVAYVALCAGSATGTKPSALAKRPDSLRARLLGGQNAPFLEELTAAPDAPIRVWRVVPAP